MSFFGHSSWPRVTNLSIRELIYHHKVWNNNFRDTSTCQNIISTKDLKYLNKIKLDNTPVYWNYRTISLRAVSLSFVFITGCYLIFRELTKCTFAVMRDVCFYLFLFIISLLSYTRTRAMIIMKKTKTLLTYREHFQVNTCFIFMLQCIFIDYLYYRCMCSNK